MANISSDPDDNSGTAVPFIGEHVDRAVSVICVILGSVMILSAVFGNSTLVVIVVKNFLRNRKKNLHDLFIANLVLDDLLLMGYWFTFFILDLALGYHPVVNGSHCTANAAILVLLYMVNLNYLVSISFNRYLHVCHYHLYRRVFTLPFTVIWCVIIWVIGFLASLPPLWGGAAGFYFYNTKTHVCSYNRDGFTYLKFMVILYTVVPPIFIAYFNFAIFRCWKKARMSVNSRYPLAKKGEKKKNLFAMWRSGKNKNETVTGTASSETSKEQGAELEAVTINTTVVDSGVVDESADTLSRSVDGANVSSSVSQGGQKSYPLDQDDTSGVEEMARNSDDLQVQVNETQHANSDSNSEDTLNADNNDSGKNVSTEIISPHVRFNEQATEAETDEERIDPDSFHRDSDSVDESSTTTSPGPSLGRLQQQPAHSEDLNTSTGRHQRRLRKKSRGREEAFVRSLLVVCILAAATFLPYTVLVIVGSYVNMPKEVLISANLMVFLNNTVNWIVYGAMNPAYKRGYVAFARRVLTACRR